MLYSFDIKFKCLKDNRFQYDTDGSGQIEFPEFCNMMSAKMGTVNDEDMIRMAFRVLDKDGSGTISSKTFKHLMTHIGNRRPQFMQCRYKIRTNKELPCRFVCKSANSALAKFDILCGL